MGRHFGVELPEIVLTRDASVIGPEIQDRISRGEELASRAMHCQDDYDALSRAHSAWGKYNRTYLERVSQAGHLVREYETLQLVWGSQDLSWQERAERLRRSIGYDIDKLRSIADRLHLWDVEPAPAPRAAVAGVAQSTHPRRVFIIHGHDYAAALELRDLLRDELGMEPVILAQEASKGRTIIDKFEQEAADCGFAFAVFTPDDVVASHDRTYSQMRPNGAFELGWFYARLGRERTVIICKKGTTLPSDLSGIVELRYTDSVRETFLSIRQELKAAGVEGAV